MVRKPPGDGKKYYDSERRASYARVALGCANGPSFDRAPCRAFVACCIGYTRVASNSEMIKAYTAANLQDAHILLGLLASSGIKARILNASAQGGLGEIPFTHTYPELWIEDARDAARARAVIAEFERPTRAEPPRRCPSCHEDNPARFEVCWKCGTSIAPE
jgi:hypothetical protein